MINIRTLNKIAKCGLDAFDEKYNIADECENPDGIILRSFSMHEMELPESLKAVARAGAGTNNIPIDKCSEKGIVVFNTPGANANAVKELVIAGLLLGSRDIVGGVNWVKTLKGDPDAAKKTEKGKSAFKGVEIEGKTLAVVGLGAIGVMVANAAHALGMDVIGYDPYISVKSALGLTRSIHISSDILDTVKNADYVTLHVPLNDSTRGFINDEVIGAMKDGAVVLNFARDALVNDEAMAKALSAGKIAKYVTDFPNPAVLEMENAVVIPHLGASTEESEDNCAVMACRQMVDYLENGNIVNSVNMPAAHLPVTGDPRICIFHQNVPDMIAKITSLISSNGINIENMVNASKKGAKYAYTLLDVLQVPDGIEDALKAIEGVMRVRTIK